MNTKKKTNQNKTTTKKLISYFFLFLFTKKRLEQEKGKTDGEGLAKSTVNKAYTLWYHHVNIFIFLRWVPQVYILKYIWKGLLICNLPIKSKQTNKPFFCVRKSDVLGIQEYKVHRDVQRKTKILHLINILICCDYITVCWVSGREFQWLKPYFFLQLYVLNYS